MSKKSKLNEIRQEAIDCIKKLMTKHRIQTVEAYDIDEGSSPIVDENGSDGNLTFTLDRVTLKDGSLEFEASNCCENHTWDEDDISTDALVGISEWLEENEKTLEELADENQTTIHVTADKGRLADALRRIANEIDRCGEDDFEEWEDASFTAQIV